MSSIDTNIVLPSDTSHYENPGYESDSDNSSNKGHHKNKSIFYSDKDSFVHDNTTSDRMNGNALCRNGNEMSGKDYESFNQQTLNGATNYTNEAYIITEQIDSLDSIDNVIKLSSQKQTDNSIQETTDYSKQNGIRVQNDTDKTTPVPNSGQNVKPKKSSCWCPCWKKKKVRDPAQDEDEKWLAWISKQFETIAGDDGEIDMDEFKTALGVKKSFFAERFFQLFDQDSSGTIELSELMEGLQLMTKGTPKQKLKFLFDVYDVDGSGCIDPEELKTVLKSSMGESSLQLSEETLDSLTMALFESADEDCSGEITFEELVAELEKHPGVLENLTISAANWLKPPEDKKKKSAKPRYFSRSYIVNNKRKLVFYLIYALINIALFILSGYRYRKANWCVIIARMCGMALNFNCAFVLVLMLRHSLTWLRSTKLGSVLPLDQSILIHKLVGYVIAVESIVHTLAHLGNLTIIELGKNRPFNETGLLPPNATAPAIVPEFWEYLFTLKSRVGWAPVPGFAFLSGVILDVILGVMVLCSLSCVRRGGHFMVFYWSHMCYVLFWLFLIFHGPIFWYFFIVPGFIFIIEKLINSKLIKLAKYGRIYITEVNLLPSKVTHLVISKPKNFTYQSGDYIFINIPAIAEYEWHPFTVSSAPEMPDSLWLHVRSAGHWTNKLYEYFDDLEPLDDNVVTVDIEGGVVNKDINVIKGAGDVYTGDNTSGIKMMTYKQLDDTSAKKESAVKAVAKDRKKDRHKKVKVEVVIDGPYGTPTREIFETEHAVLIGSGIGVTPFASILQSVMYRYNESRRECPKCDHVWFGEIPQTAMKLNKMDFVWINRSQNSFEWFISLLAKLELQQTHEGSFENFLEMQMYMTSALSKSDMKGLGLQMAMEILHKKENKDVVTGLKTRTQPGRPNWKEVFTKIANEKKGKVKVFFCGSPLLSKQLKKYCEEFKFSFSKENF